MIIKVAASQAEFFGLMQLRKNVFTNEQHVDVNIEMDEDDLTALHFVVLQDDQVIATCRLVLHYPHAKLGMMAVAAVYRHQNIGSQLLSFAEANIKAAGFKTVSLGAQIQALEFYLHNGYQVCSAVFYDADIPHKMMEKNL